ncbi:type I toxin-antitoxin system Fst family toxin [Staphylococcus equorum]|nr:type I toxin-antitoxin system Fst family toxin [Staphylococcus equorum]QQT19223.1 type I toxin-antitoxin system Fst family toxin [Staphylococcus equorum]
MIDVLVHILEATLSGCIVAYFAYWLRHRND